MSLSAYLAKNYLNASADPDSARPKKRRKRDKTEQSHTLIIADDEDGLHLSSLKKPAAGDDDADTPQFDTAYRSAEFRKSKKNNWNDLSKRPAIPGGDEADRILEAAGLDAERAQAEAEMEDAPAIVEDDSRPKMESGARAGLQTAADTEALELAEARRQNAERKLKKQQQQQQNTKDTETEAEQTVYRDATGRRIDISMKRAEARAAEAARLKAERKETEAAQGDVQLAAKAARKAELDEAKFLPVARGVDDEAMNDELKGQVRWDDPMAAYMARKQAEEEPVGRSRAGAQQQTTRLKEYTGAAAPNRYGIRPGWRWDGVDRGNGFEVKWFQARGRKSRNEKLEFQWQMDE